MQAFLSCYVAGSLGGGLSEPSFWAAIAVLQVYRLDLFCESAGSCVKSPLLVSWSCFCKHTCYCKYTVNATLPSANQNICHQLVQEPEVINFCSSYSSGVSILPYSEWSKGLKSNTGVSARVCFASRLGRSRQRADSLICRISCDRLGVCVRFDVFFSARHH